MEKITMLGKIEGNRRREQQKMRWLDITTDLMDMNLSKLQEIVEDRVWLAVVQEVKRVGHDLVTEQQQQQPSECSK